MPVQEYDKPVADAKRAVKAFAQEITDDLDERSGRISWWAGYSMDPDVAAVLSHYLVSVTRAVEANLDEAAVHLYQYNERIYGEDAFVRLRASAAKGSTPDLRRIKHADRLRAAALDAELGAFFRSIGSVLDTLAGTVIGIAGLKTNILKAHFGTLNATDPSDAYPRLPRKENQKLRSMLATEGTPSAQHQESLLRSLRSALRFSGPPGWAQWALETRNSMIHRSRWMSPIVADRPNRRSELRLIRPLPRIPGVGEGAALLEMDEMLDTYLSEDALVSMRGALGSTDALVKAVIEQCSILWARRRDNPALLVQPETQWTSVEVTSFEGYEPSANLEAFERADAILMHPNEAKRLSALLRDGAENSARLRGQAAKLD
ncbi:hypothetical protein GS534_00735 [Rhodococcus hoagii]|nr:hypothetical protein [Prescottella equi]